MGYSESMYAKAIELTRSVIEMTAAADSGHPSSAASLAHIVTVLMYDHMRYDPADPANLAADRLVLSEGHSAPIVYAAGADLGIAIKNNGETRQMTTEDSLELRAIDSPIDGHPNPAEGFIFFPAATGSLGQGLSVSAGMAAASQLNASDSRVYCLIGDGESREGQIWEAIDFIVDYELAAVCPIFNCNGYGQSDPVSVQQMANRTESKLHGAGFDVKVVDGHNPQEIKDALVMHTQRIEEGKPFAIVAKTVKGWGFTSVAKDGLHGKPVTGTDKDIAFEQLQKMLDDLPSITENLHPTRPSVIPSVKATSPVLDFRQALEEFGQADALDSGKLATRRAYGHALRALGRANPNIVVLDGDTKNSTFSEFFANDKELAGRFFECRIAEQHMVSCAGGLAAAGKIPFVSSFGRFIMRGYDQLDMAMISRFNVKIVGSHIGANIGADGPSQMALSDVAFIRSLTKVRDRDNNPIMYLLNPADARCAYDLTVAMASHDGACYMRTLRPDTPFLYGDEVEFTLGGHEVVSQGEDLLIVASAYMVHEAIKALPILEQKGINATLVDLYSIPFDVKEIVLLAKQNGGRVITLEDNYGAGIGSEVGDALLEEGGSFILKQMFVRKIPKSGRSTDDLIRYVGLSVEDIVEAAQRLTLS